MRFTLRRTLRRLILDFLGSGRFAFDPFIAGVVEQLIDVDTEVSAWNLKHLLSLVVPQPLLDELLPLSCRDLLYIERFLQL